MRREYVLTLLNTKVDLMNDGTINLPMLVPEYITMMLVDESAVQDSEEGLELHDELIFQAAEEDLRDVLFHTYGLRNFTVEVSGDYILREVEEPS